MHIFGITEHLYVRYVCKHQQYLPFHEIINYIICSSILLFCLKGVCTIM